MAIVRSEKDGTLYSTQVASPPVTAVVYGRRSANSGRVAAADRFGQTPDQSDQASAQLDRQIA